MRHPVRQAMARLRDRALSPTTRAIDDLRGEIAALRAAAAPVPAPSPAVVTSAPVAVAIGPTELLVKLFNGMTMYLDPRDVSVTPHLALDGIWEPAVTRAWTAALAPGDTVLDIGANVGYFGLLAAGGVDVGRGRVVLFEANPALIPYAEKNLTVNWVREQATVEHYAVVDPDARPTMTLTVLKDTVGSSTLHSAERLASYMGERMPVTTEALVEVPTTTIDAYCRRHGIGTVDLVKMDVEGFEDRAYAGMRGIVGASPRLTLFVEFTKDGYGDPKAFFEQLLEDFGHVYYIGDDGRLVEPEGTGYAEVVLSRPPSWAFVMLVFSKCPRQESNPQPGG